MINIYIGRLLLMVVSIVEIHFNNNYLYYNNYILLLIFILILADLAI